jgi:hypothetical protein
MWDLFRAVDRGWTVEQLHEATRIDPWFLRQFIEIAALRNNAMSQGLDGLDAAELRRLKRAGFGDQELALALKTTENRGARAPACARPQAGLQARRHVRRRVRIVHAVHVQLVRADVRIEPEPAEQGGDSRERAEPHRPGHRIRLLLFATRPSRSGKKASRR